MPNGQPKVAYSNPPQKKSSFESASPSCSATSCITGSGSASSSSSSLQATGTANPPSDDTCESSSLPFDMKEVNCDMETITPVHVYWWFRIYWFLNLLQTSWVALTFGVCPNIFLHPQPTCIPVHQAGTYEANIGPSRKLAGQGNRAAKEGRFLEAVRCYSEAIELYPLDHRLVTPQWTQ